MSVLDEPTALPSPEEVQATFEQMRAAVLAEDARLLADADDAREMLATAERERESLRSRYPMFFPTPDRVDPRPSGGGTPNVEQMNKLLRTVAEHPDQTLKQLGRRLNFSTSWTGRIVSEINERGAYVGRDRHGRSYIYRLTEEGSTLLNRGGVRE
jgi:predicted transcriptional regulator